MSDRIKRMQNVTPELLNDFPNAYCEDVFWAVARIEELEVRLWAADYDANEAEAYAKKLEAKLAKAVKALKYYAQDDDDGGWLATKTLAELTGGKDE